MLKMTWVNYQTESKFTSSVRQLTYLTDIYYVIYSLLGQLIGLIDIEIVNWFCTWLVINWSTETQKRQLVE